jgi:hypothetical protein
MDKYTYAKIRDLAYQHKKEEILAKFSPQEIKEAYRLVSSNWNLNYETYTPRWCYAIKDCAWEVMGVRAERR